MVTTLVILGLLAVTAAIGAAYRVQDKRAARVQMSTSPTAGSNTTQQRSSTQSASVRDAESPEALRSIPQPDRDSAQETVPARLGTQSPSRQIEISPIALEPDPDIPLATSISVSELVQPDAVENTKETEPVASDHVATDAPLAAEPAAESHETRNLLEEIAELGRSEHTHQAEHLAKYIHHPDSTVRVAIAFALGELAASQQGKRMEAIVPLLSQLTQDADIQVRVQAAEALATIQSPDLGLQS